MCTHKARKENRASDAHGWRHLTVGLVGARRDSRQASVSLVGTRAEPHQGQGSYGMVNFSFKSRSMGVDGTTQSVSLLDYEERYI